ncbi:MAG: hypothetical protein K6U09_00825 [Acidobacteriia bacterium]|mgnify:CR=1 FL=1|nr:hypothetical protein [Terriglobia bacterium]
MLESGVSVSLSPGEVFMSNSRQLGDCRHLSEVPLRRPVLAAFPNSATPQPTQTIFALRSHKGAPAVLISATHTSSDLLAGARLKNVGEKTIVAYRIGWEIHIPDQKKPETTLGEWMNVPPGIPPGEIAQVPPQAVSVELARRGATRIAFFVGEVKFSDGTTWRHSKNDTDRPTD